MKISGKREYLVSLESVAMTDIVLNMFIFFFISFSLLYTFSPYRIKKLDVKLPEAKAASTVRNANQADILITNEGLLYLNQQLLTRQEFKEKMDILHRDNPGLVVLLRSDRLTQFKNIVSVLDTLTELGIKNLNIAATSEE